MHKKIILLILCFFRLTIAQFDLSQLEKVYDVNRMNNISFDYLFYQYEDTEQYGAIPIGVTTSDLLLLNPLVNWNNSHSFMLLNPKKLYVAALPDVYISPEHLGTIFSKKQQLLFSFLCNPNAPIYWPIDSHISKYPIIHKTALATVQGPTLFYHSIIDRLPSVLLLKESVLQDPSIKLLINSTSTPPGYLLEYLSLLGIEKEQLEISTGKTVYHVDKLYFATPFLMEPIPKKLLNKFREVLIKASIKRSAYKKKNSNLIVIIQRRENDRKIQNINQLIALIHNIFRDVKHEILLFDASMPVADQIQIFNDTRVVIGVLASGQSNILYCNPKTHIIDIRPNWQLPKGEIWNHGREWCWWLACASDLNYWPIFETFNLSDKFVHCPLQKMVTILEKIQKNFVA